MPANDNVNAGAGDIDPAGLASLVNAMFEDRIPVIHRLGIRIVEVRDGFIAGTAPLAGNLNYQGSMYAGTCSVWERRWAPLCSRPILT